MAKHLRNRVNRNIRHAKAGYIIDQLQLHKNNSSKFWKIIKNVVPHNKTKTDLPIKLVDDNNGIIQEEDIADFINDFFINVGISVTSNTTKHQNSAGLNVHEQDDSTDDIDLSEDSLSLNTITHARVRKLTKSLNASKSSGLPTLGPQMVKNSLLALNDQFTHLINTAIRNNKFPKAWKKATVIPIPKSGDLKQVGNYRPISLLPSPGKILEKIVHEQINNHLEQGQFLTASQYGFRKNRSAIHAITQLLNHINIGLNKGAPTLALFIDFRKAFDCLQYNKLVNKLRCMNLSPDTIEWVKHYLTDRQQCTRANNTISDFSQIKQGVPQGSILGPLLYIIYANDIAQKITHCKSTYYADDTVIYATGKNLKQVFSKVQKDLGNLEDWCSANGIHINTNKTKYVLFNNSSRLNSDAHTLTFKGKLLERQTQFNYLGVILDEHLTFENQIKSTINKVSAKISQLKKLRRFLNTRASLLVYKNMILPILEYGDIYMSSSTVAYRKKLQVLQNRALKCALGKDNRYDTKQLHAEAKIEKLKFRRKAHLILHMHQVSHMPGYKNWKAKPKINTRSSKKKLITTKKPSTTKFQSSITYLGPKTWNALPHDIQQIDDYRVFKQKLFLLLKSKLQPQQPHQQQQQQQQNI